MKKKIFLTLVMAVIFALTLVLMVSAESVHAGKVDLNATVTLNDGTVCKLFDADGNALIWYLDTNSELQSIRADDSKVKYRAADWTVNIFGATGPEVLEVKIVLDDTTTISYQNIVVFNIMDDDVLTNYNVNNKNLNMPVTCMKEFIRSSTNLEYVFLRLDTIAVMATAFQSCSNLKYVNLEDLTELIRIGGGSTFGGCTSLFKGEVLDLTKTKLISIDGGGAFASVPFADIKFPSTLTTLGDWCLQNTGLVSFVFPTGVTSIGGSQFNDCKSLKEICINKTTTKIIDRAFNNTALEKVFFVGTLDELNALLDNTGANNNAPFWAVVGENRANLISYADYSALEDKSGNYVVYNYSYCDAYNDGNHDVQGDNACVGTCSVCGLAVVSHSDSALVNVTVEYASFAKVGAKVTSCENKGCTYSVTEDLPALFICKGFSSSKTGNGISLGFEVNNKAIADYTSLTGKTVKYGVFAGSQKNLGTSDIFDADVSEKVITAEIKATEFTAFDIKVVGFETETQKSTLLALGAYVALTDGEETIYSYMQCEEPEENAKYSFTSYNNQINA